MNFIVSMRFSSIAYLIVSSIRKNFASSNFLFLRIFRFSESFENEVHSLSEIYHRIGLTRIDDIEHMMWDSSHLFGRHLSCPDIESTIDLPTIGRDNMCVISLIFEVFCDFFYLSLDLIHIYVEIFYESEHDREKRDTDKESHKTEGMFRNKKDDKGHKDWKMYVG